MKVINKSNLKRLDLIGVKGKGKSSLIFRAGESQYGYTNSRVHGNQYQPAQYASLEGAPPELLAEIEQTERQCAELQAEAIKLEQQIRQRMEALRLKVREVLPPVNIEGLPKLEQMVDNRGDVWEEMRAVNAPYIPYGCQLFKVPTDENDPRFTQTVRFVHPEKTA